MKTYDNIGKTDQREDFTSGCLLYYPYFKEQYNVIAIDLRKQQALDLDPNAIQQINFTGNLEPFSIFHKELREYCKFILLQYNINLKRLKITF